MPDIQKSLTMVKSPVYSQFTVKQGYRLKAKHEPFARFCSFLIGTQDLELKTFDLRSHRQKIKNDLLRFNSARPISHRLPVIHYCSGKIICNKKPCCG